jgi:Cephalosporin hydroxylase.
MVTLVKGQSFKPETMSAVRQALGSDQVGLLILDADAAKRRDIDCYRDKFAEGSWMVIDDIYGADANEKDHAKPRGRGCISGGRFVGSAGILRLEHMDRTLARTQRAII